MEAIIKDHTKQGKYVYKELTGIFDTGPVEEKQLIKPTGNIYVGQVKKGT